MVDLIGLMVGTLILTIIGLGGGYWVWTKVKPKRMTWKAKVYQLGEGIKPYKRDKEGNIIHKIKLSELKPYCKDIIEKLEVAHGITVYRLKKLDRNVNPITQDVMEFWGKEDKEVSVVMIGDSFALLKNGYDKTTGDRMFDPVPHDKMYMVSSEIATRKARKKEKKDILEAISPWVVAGLIMLTCFGIAYVGFSSLEKMTKEMSDATKYYTEKQVEIAKIYQNVQDKKIIVMPKNNLGNQNVTNVTNNIPPTITG